VLPGAQAIICGDDRITARVLAAAPDLRVISKMGHRHRLHRRRRGPPPRHRRLQHAGRVQRAGADTVMGYVLLAGRQLVRMNADMHHGVWRKPQLGRSRNRRWALSAVGNCGRAVARRAAAFGMHLLGADIVEIDRQVKETTGLEQVSLHTLLARGRHRQLQLHAEPSSFHLLNAETLALMKPTAFVINTSRGPVIDERALEVALAEGHLAGAALDVFEEEPLPASSLLRAIPNCWLAPHNANSSVAAAGARARADACQSPAPTPL
jgi:D-3-phosphoglycerate dehydrogenase